jgi:biopolymer transport protein ExbD
MAVKIKKSAAFELLNITPLIDVVFQLLLFFLVATRFEQEDRELDVKLPSASEARPLVASVRTLFVNIDDQGRYFADGKLMTLDEVEDYLVQAKANNPVGQSVTIRADKRVPLDYAVQVMNLCNKAGLTEYTITTEGQR